MWTGAASDTHLLNILNTVPNNPKKPLICVYFVPVQ